MRFGLTLTAALGAVLVAGSVLAAVPAHASTAEAYVDSDLTAQFDQTCASASTCNAVAIGTEIFNFGRTGSTTSSLGIYYKVVNVTAVNGVDFSTPTTGEVIIPAGQSTKDLSVPLLDSGLFDAYKYFSVEITGTTTPITLENTTATGGIEGGNIPSDCSFTYGGGLSLAMDCTARPPTQEWYLAVYCDEIHAGQPLWSDGNEVTGDGTSTATCPNTIEAETLDIDS
jgi:hypothetical protein